MSSIYGDDHRLRLWLEEQAHPYVLAMSGKAYVWIGMRQYAIKALLMTLPDEGWTPLSAGDGAKGPRWYDWYLLSLNPPSKLAGAAGFWSGVTQLIPLNGRRSWSSPPKPLSCRSWSEWLREVI
jgi:hypothetical protein